MHHPPNPPANRNFQGLGLPWLALGAVFVLALGLLAAYQDSVRWKEAVVWHQLLGGLLIAIFGSGIAGWGIATFIASRIPHQLVDACAPRPHGDTSRYA